MAKAQNLREAIYHLIEQTNNDLKVQQDATNFDFRKRMYEMKRAKEELEYQIKKVNRGTFNWETFACLQIVSGVRLSLTQAFLDIR